MRFFDANFVEYTPTNWLTYDDVILVPQRSDFLSRNDPKIDTSAEIFHGRKISVPIVSAPMDTVTGAEMAAAMHAAGGAGFLHRFYLDEESRLLDIEKVFDATGFVIFSIGVKKEEINFVAKVIGRLKNKDRFNQNSVIVNVDVANGHAQYATKMVHTIKTSYHDLVRVGGGNVSTPDGVVNLVNAGADFVRVGIGSGSMCSTRIVTGHGVPMISSIILARKAINSVKRNVSIIADGGIRNSGDIVKAIAAGADLVMVGRMLAGCNESASDIVNLDGVNKKLFRGQSSANFLSDIGKSDVAPEGEHMYIDLCGPVRDVMFKLSGGLRSGMTYAGARNLIELTERATFIEQSHHAYIEGTPHGTR